MCLALKRKTGIILKRDNEFYIKRLINQELVTRNVNSVGAGCMCEEANLQNTASLV